MFQSFIIQSLIEDDNDTFTEKLYNNSHLINFKNLNGESLLHYAAYYGYVDKFTTLINMGSNIEKTNNGDTLLHYTALGGKDFFLFNQLIKDGFNLLETNNKGITPFHICKNISAFSFAYRYLYMKNLNFRATNIVDGYSNNPAHLAMKNKHLDIYEFLKFEEPNIEFSLNYFNETPLMVPYKPYTTYL